MGGCFRQVSPIVRHGDRAAIVRATIKRSSIWRFVKTMKLTENMRARSLNGKFSIYSIMLYILRLISFTFDLCFSNYLLYYYYSFNDFLLLLLDLYT
jgi:hypothetical protein